jgi:hypothetical protein
VTRADEQANAVDAKVELDLLIADAQAIPPRQTTTIDMTTSDPSKLATSALDATLKVGGRIVQNEPARSTDGIDIEHVVLDVPAAQRWVIVDLLDKSGSVKSEQVTTSDAPQGTVERARIEATIQSEQQIVAADSGLWSSFKNGISTSVVGLLWSVKIIVIGLLLVVPWALVTWGGMKLFRSRRKKTATG